jgi:inner membrane protein
MDNVTHALTGAAFAELVFRVRAWRKPDGSTPTLRGALWLSSMLASNAPDADILLAPSLRSPLGYLLHHRGHTHTVLIAPLLALLSVGLGWLWARRRGGLPAGSLLTTSVLAIAMSWLHVAMDFGNSYGVHPFWPFDAEWIYGDSIFIVEPTLLVTLAIPLAFAAETRIARAVLATVAVLVLVLAATVPMVSYAGLGLTLALAVIASLGARAATPLVRPMIAVGALVVLEVVFFAVHVEAEIHAEGTLAAAFPRATTLDVAMSPSPGNPLCWGALGVAIEDGDLVTRRMGISLLGTIQHVDGCRFTTPNHTTATRTTIERISTESIRFFDETRTPLALLRDYASTSEDTAAFLRFSRAPYVLLREGEPTVAGDVRFDREHGIGFGELEVHQDTPLAGWIPPWQPPRLDAIDPAHAPPPRTHDIVTE